MSLKRNILLLVDRFDIGGAEGQILLLARLLHGSGRYRVHLACLRRDGVLLAKAESISAGEIPEFPLTSFYDRNMVTQLRRFASFVRERGVEVVHTEGFYTNVFGITGASLARVPARVAFRGETAGWRNAKQDFLERCAYRLSSVIHANSEAVKRYLVERGVSPQRIAVIYNGVDVPFYSSPSPGLGRDELLSRLGLPAGGRRRFVTLLANMRHEVKNQPMFLRAARRVREVVPEATFVLAGEGELAESLRVLAGELGLGESIFFTGRCESVPDLLAVSDVCVLSSKAEGFSNSILEYMAAARPVVVTDVGGAREAVVEGETGYIVPSGDDERMASRIASLLLEPERARRMGERGQEVVRQKFSSEAQLENTHALYERLLGRASASALSRAAG